MDEFRTRRSPRMGGFDYRTAASYFVTICAHNMECIFGPPNCLNAFGQIARQEIGQMEKYHPWIEVFHSVVMPNHVHMIISIYEENQKSLSEIVGNYKAGVSRRIHIVQPERLVWQRSFHDHMIRTKREWDLIWQYISDNPKRWEMDQFFRKIL